MILLGILPFLNESANSRRLLIVGGNKTKQYVKRGQRAVKNNLYTEFLGWWWYWYGRKLAFQLAYISEGTTRLTLTNLTKVEISFIAFRLNPSQRSKCFGFNFPAFLCRTKKNHCDHMIAQGGIFLLGRQPSYVGTNVWSSDTHRLTDRPGQARQNSWCALGNVA